jgi:hypothetical protein
VPTHALHCEKINAIWSRITEEICHFDRPDWP